MTSQEAYVIFTDLVEENTTNNNLDVSPEVFVSIFNISQDMWVEWTLEKRNEDAIRYVAPLLSLNKKLNLNNKKETHNNYRLPKDFFDLSNLNVYASTDCCGSDRLRTFEVKNDDENELYFDQNNEPSYEYRETYYSLANNDVAVFKKGFEIDKVELSYYRYPRRIDIKGYIRVDGTNSQDQNPELDDKVVNRILIASAKHFSANKGDIREFQLNQDRLYKSI